MAYIDKETFNIFSEIAIPEVEKRSFECDDLIAPVISILNKKGYKTKFCCCGHPYPELTSMYILIYEGYNDGISSIFGSFESIDYEFFDKAIEYREISLSDIPEDERFDPSEIDETRPYHVFYVKHDKLIYGSIAYISFEKKYFSERDLPIGWEFYDEEYFGEIDSEDDEKGCFIQYTFSYEQDVFYFFTQQIAVFMELYNWAKALPKNVED